MSVWSEFQEFAVKGNVMDMAVGVLIGAAFSSVVSSAVDDLLMPPLGLVTGGLDFAEQFVVLREGAVVGPYTTLEAAHASGAVLLTYGNFINQLVSFSIIAAALFVVVRWTNGLKSAETPAAPKIKPCAFCQEPIALSAKRCPHCTSHLEPAATMP